MAEDVPVSPVNIEARDALQIVKVGKRCPPENAGRSWTWAECGTCFAQYAPHSIPEPKDRLCAWGELQVHEHIIVDIVPDGQGAGLPFRRFCDRGCWGNR